MRTSYKTGRDINYHDVFDVDPPAGEWREEIYKDYPAPIVKRSFSGAWRGGQLCLIPCNSFYEPNYESGKAVRWRISMADGQPFAIAGLWLAWNEPDGQALSFTMLTLNADQHPLMSRFHKPGSEKRSVVIMPPAHYEEWLECREPEIARTFLKLMSPEEMNGEADQLPPRGPKSNDSPLPG